MKNINDEWILLSDSDIQINENAILNLPEDTNIGCVYFDYIKKDGSIKYHNYFHILLSEKIKLNHLLVRKNFALEIKKDIFETILNIYNIAIVRHIPITAFKIK